MLVIEKMDIYVWKTHMYQLFLVVHICWYLDILRAISHLLNHKVSPTLNNYDSQKQSPTCQL